MKTGFSLGFGFVIINGEAVKILFEIAKSEQIAKVFLFLSNNYEFLFSAFW
jgi:hypothetical protein